MKNLVIVESPAKAKTIEKFLGPDYVVKSSNGHIRDLAKKDMSIDIENQYEPEYQITEEKHKLVAELKKAVKDADMVWLASDEDREGEAIAWHLQETLKLNPEKTKRIVFNEITKNAILHAIENPRGIDMDLVDAQQARRVLDRLVGYEISPILWSKIKPALSAGRVQSVAVRLIVEREEEIKNFVSHSFYRVTAQFHPASGRMQVLAELSRRFDSLQEATDFMQSLVGCNYKVQTIDTKPAKRTPAPPFTTSTLQQEASRKLGFSVARTMQIAQQLYESGFITYMRTDSVNLSELALSMAKTEITNLYGENYVKTRRYQTKIKGAQEAHEAIRPTYMSNTTINADTAQRRLYELIWKRAIASQMADAEIEKTIVEINISDHEEKFVCQGEQVRFDGFLKVYMESTDDEPEEDASSSHTLPKVVEGMQLTLDVAEALEHHTQHAPRYTEASLVKKLEDLGIGRPSTYAPTISTILARHYVTKENKNLFITEIGEIVNNIMKEQFPSIVDVNFTVNFESLLDGVEEGKVAWKTVIENFYPDLHTAVEKATDELEHAEIHDEETDVVCEDCGRNMVIKYGPHGKFLACPGFPECRNTKPYFEKVGVSCPKCGSDVVIKTTRKGRRYYGCLGFPECDFMSWAKPSDKKCPKCGGILVHKGSKLTCQEQGCGYSEEDKAEA